MEDNNLRQIFRGHYRPTEEEFAKLWNNCIFIPDANVLLNIYRYSPTTCDALIDIFKDVSERLWITHQAASEYHNQRLNVIGQQESAYENIKNKFRELQKNNETQLNSFSKHPFINIKKFSGMMDDTLTEIENELDECKKKHPNLLDDDELRDNITILFEDKVGASYSPEKLKELCDFGEKRYENEIPPGYLDAGKGDEKQFGDLIIWSQIIDYAKLNEKPIVFITDDRKEDWWLKFKGKTIGPRPELIDEIYREAGVDFYMYQTEQFMEFAQKSIKRAVAEEAIKEVQEIKQFDEECKQKLLLKQLSDNIRAFSERNDKDAYLEEMGNLPERNEQHAYLEEMRNLPERNEKYACWEEIEDLPERDKHYAHWEEMIDIAKIDEQHAYSEDLMDLTERNEKYIEYMKFKDFLAKNKRFKKPR